MEKGKREGAPKARKTRLDLWKRKKHYKSKLFEMAKELKELCQQHNQFLKDHASLQAECIHNLLQLSDAKKEISSMISKRFELDKSVNRLKRNNEISKEERRDDDIIFRCSVCLENYPRDRGIPCINDDIPHYTCDRCFSSIQNQLITSGSEFPNGMLKCYCGSNYEMSLKKVYTSVQAHLLDTHIYF